MEKIHLVIVNLSQEDNDYIIFICVLLCWKINEQKNLQREVTFISGRY